MNIYIYIYIFIETRNCTANKPQAQLKRISNASRTHLERTSNACQTHSTCMSNVPNPNFKMHLQLTQTLFKRTSKHV